VITPDPIETISSSLINFFKACSTASQLPIAEKSAGVKTVLSERQMLFRIFLLRGSFSSDIWHSMLAGLKFNYGFLRGLKVLANALVARSNI
jgi:hypothetical protein